jgi:cell division protein FtsQ
VRDQVVSQKVGHRSGIGGKGRSTSLPQRPSRREREGGEGLAARLRAIAGYIPIALKVGLILSLGVLIFLGYRAAASASFFALRQVEVQGSARASETDIKTLVRQTVKQDGVWRADLDAISKHLQAVPWVRTAVVTRVLPDGIRVRITERQPIAVVRNSAGRFMWVDDEAVFLDEMAATDQMPNFFLRGLSEEETTAARTENRERVAKFVSLQREWEAQGLSERVSEVNLLDVRDVRVQLAGDDSQIEIRLGGLDQGTRLSKALNVLDSQRATVRGPLISYIDLSQGKRAVVGLVSGSQSVTDEQSGDDVVTAPEAQAVERNRNEPAASGAEKTKTQKPRSQTRKPDQRRT